MTIANAAGATSAAAKAMVMTVSRLGVGGGAMAKTRVEVDLGQSKKSELGQIGSVGPNLRCYQAEFGLGQRCWVGPRRDKAAGPDQASC
jgi:hypothetical protein